MLGAWLGRAPCRIDYVMVFLEKIVNRPLKNHVRYAKMRKWPLKSAVRYAKTQNRLSPLSSHMTFDAPKCNTYATFFWRLHSLWAPSDLFFAQIDFPFDLWCSGPCGPRGPIGYMESRSEPGYTRPSHEDGTFTTGKLPQTIYSIYSIYSIYIVYIVYIVYSIYSIYSLYSI